MNFTQLLLKAGPARLFAALGIAAVAAALLFTLVLRMGGESNALLFAGVEMREMSQITQRLEAADIEYELRGDGTSIYVARSRVLDARMMLSAEGLPSRGSIGYEIFDEPDALGQTQFQQNINRLRALEGELARTIGSLDGISSARVHLVLPERQLFARDREQPSASIVLGLRRDALTPGQVRAIRNLVASATPGLTASRVTILDETGRLLAAATGDEETAIAEGADARQAAAEDRIRRTVTDIVEGVVGAGNARVQVTAEMDFNRVSETAERYNPEERAIRSTSTTEETTSNAERAQGVSAGVNVPDAQPGGASSGSQTTSSSNQETINYEISRTTRTEIIEGGRLRRLSVAVAVDGTVAAPEGGGEPAYTPRTQEEMQRLTALVRSAVGFNAERGDVVEVVNTRFARVAPTEGESTGGGMFAFLGDLDVMRIIEIVAALIASLAFVFFVLRPLIGSLVRGGAPSGGQGALPGGGQPPALPAPDGSGAAALPEGDSIDLAQIQGRVRGSSVKKIAEVVEQHPDESAQIIRGWLNNAL